MTATLMVSRACSRCVRVEREEVSLEDAARLAKTGLKAPAALKVMQGGEALFEFETLCGVCQQVVASYLKNVSKRLKGHSSAREKAPEEAEVEILEEA